MNQRVRDLLLIYIFGVLINAVVALLVSNPGYTDAYYYFNGARFIIGGKWEEPYLWNYVGSPTLPNPAFSYWQPLPSMLAAAGIMIFGRRDPFGSAQAIYVLVAGLLPVISYLVASRLGERRHALLAGFLTVFSGFYVIYWSLPESFTPFALAGSGALLFAGWAIQDKRWWFWLLSGIFAGLAHLSRADGVLVLIVIILAAGYFFLFNRVARQRLLFLWMVMLGYLAIMLPWFIRNWIILGSIQSPGGLGAVWLNDYNDLFSYPSNLSAERFFSVGWRVILDVKWNALIGNLATLIGVQNLVFLIPLTVIGLWRRWRSSLLLPAVVYWIVLFCFMSLVFSLVGVRGGYFHSGGALLPFFYSVAAIGLDDSIRWISKRRSGWRFEQASRVFRVSAVILAALMTVYLVMGRIVGFPLSGEIEWNSTDAAYVEIGDTLNGLEVLPDENVMSNNPPGFYYYTGRGGIPIPNGGEDQLLRAADDYGIQYLVVDRNVPEGLEDLYASGPVTERLELVKIYRSADPIYLYRIMP